MQAQVNATSAAVLCRALLAGDRDIGSCRRARHVVLSPGSRNTPLVLAVDACARASAVLERHVVLDERVAGFLALGLARASGAPAVLVCTSGSAAAHYLPALIEASESAVPLVVLTADRPPELHHAGAPQTVAQRDLFAAHVRWSVDLGVPTAEVSPRCLRSMAAQALDRAQGAHPGPVHLNVPFREPLWEPPGADFGGGDAELEAAAIVRAPPRAEARAVEDLARRLAACERGVIVCGPRAPHPPESGSDRLGPAVAGLAAQLGWPVLADASSQVRFGPHVRGGDAGQVIVSCADALARSDVFARRHRPELVLRIGRVPTSKPLSRWLAAHGVDRTLLVDAAGAWHDPDHVAVSLCVAEPAGLCEALARSASLTQRGPGPWLARWQEAERAAQRSLAAACAHGFWEGAVVRLLTDRLPAGAVLHVGSSMPVRDLDSFAPCRDSSITVFANRGANGIDGTLSTAFGEGLAWPHGPLVVLTGDLAFLHDVGGLRAASQAGARGVVVLLNNAGGGIFDYLPIAHHEEAFQHYFRTPQRADIGALCAGCEVRWQRAASLEALQRALDVGLGSDAVTVVEAVIDPSASRQAHHAAWLAAAEALVQVGRDERGGGSR